jgi:hypothetical protein
MNKQLIGKFKKVTKSYIENNDLIRNAGTTSLLLQYALKEKAAVYQVFPNKLFLSLEKVLKLFG